MRKQQTNTSVRRLNPLMTTLMVSSFSWPSHAHEVGSCRSIMSATERKPIGFEFWVHKFWTCWSLVRHHTQVYKVLLVKQVTSLSHQISQLALSVASAPRSQISQPRPWAHVQHFIFQVFALRFLRPGTAGIDWPTRFRWSWCKSSKGSRVEPHLDRYDLSYLISFKSVFLLWGNQIHRSFPKKWFVISRHQLQPAPRCVAAKLLGVFLHQPCLAKVSLW